MKKSDSEKWVITKKEHSSFVNTFPVGTKVKIIGCDDIRGYDIQAEDGRKICEIGWEV